MALTDHMEMPPAPAMTLAPLPAIHQPAERSGDPQRGYRPLTGTRVGRGSLESRQVMAQFLSAHVKAPPGRGLHQGAASSLTRWPSPPIPPGQILAS